MDWKKMAKNIEGMQTVETIGRSLNVSKRVSINYISELRKRGYVKTTRGKGKKRVYEITSIKQKHIGNPGLYDFINENSPIKIVPPYKHRIHDRKMTAEEAITLAIQTKDFRIILSSLALFRKVRDWSRLYEFAKNANVRRKVGAMYELSRRVVPKVRRIDGRIREKLIKGNDDRYMIPNLRSKDFKDIEMEWKVFVPFNKTDTNRYR